MDESDFDDYNLVRLVHDIRNEDTFFTIMRAQMHIEQELRRFIVSRAHSPKHARFNELDLEAASRLAFTLGLNTEIKPALAMLVTLRRRFSSNLDMKFGDQEANNFYNALGPDLKGIIREIYDELRTKENLVEFKRQTPVNRLAYFLLGIWSAISTDRKHLLEDDVDAIPREYVTNLQARRSAFFQVLENEDDLGMVIRGHIHLEHELREFIFAASPQPEEAKLSEYDYVGLLGLAMTLGLDSTLEAGLLAVGRLRNKFAHRLDIRLTEDEAKKIYATLLPSVRADAEQSWTQTVHLRSDTGRPSDLLESSPKDLIAVSIAMLWMGVVGDHLKLRVDSIKHS